MAQGRFVSGPGTSNKACAQRGPVPRRGAARLPSSGALERQANDIGGRIGAALDPDAVAEGPLSNRARAVAERYVGPLPPIDLRRGSDSELAPRALAATHGSLVRFREGALGSDLHLFRNVLGHELVHVAQQRRLGARTQNLLVDGVKVPDATIRKSGGGSLLVIDGVPVLKLTGDVELQARYDEGALSFTIAVRASFAESLRDLRFLDAMYPALKGRVFVSEPSSTFVMPSEAEPRSRSTQPEQRVRLVGTFGRSASRAGAGPHKPPSMAPVSTALQPPAPPVAAQPAPSRVATEKQEPTEAAVDRGTNPYRALSVAERSARLNELLDHWFTGADIVQLFEASANDAEFLQLEEAASFDSVLDKVDDPFRIVQLGAAGPILPAFRARVNRARADYLESRARDWGPQRAEIFALYLVDTTTDDDVESVLTLLAGDQELHLTVALMPMLQKRLADRGIDLTKFKDRGWKAIDIATGLGHVLDDVMSTSQLAQGNKGMAAMQEAAALPDPYRDAVTSVDTAAVMQALTPGNVILGAADQAFFGLPSGVKGVVYDLPRSVIGGVEELAKGHVAGGVEMITMPVIMVISIALGVRAFRRARVAALLELTGEGKALYDSLKSSIGSSGIQRVAKYVQKSSEARILVAKTGAEGILALHATEGDVAAAWTMMRERQRLIELAGRPSPVRTGKPNTPYARPHEVPYTQPPDMQIVKPGSPLRVENLNPKKVYLWVLDEEGDFRIASEGQGEMFPRRGRLGSDHPQAGETPLKHGDLTPAPGGVERGVARAGGELHAEIVNGKPTGRWTMDHESSYSFARLDRTKLGRSELEAARRLLGTTGTDISKIILPPLEP